MKLKYTLVTAFAFLTISSSVLYTSCTKDACADLKCQNNGTCTDGFCSCPTGYEGTECEVLSSDRFTGTYYGTSVKTTEEYPTGTLPTLFDTVVIYATAEPNRVGVVRFNNAPSTIIHRDTVFGFINGRYVDVDSVNKNNYKRYTTVELKSNGLNYQSVEINQINDSTTYKTVVAFIGPRAFK